MTTSCTRANISLLYVFPSSLIVSGHYGSMKEKMGSNWNQWKCNKRAELLGWYKVLIKDAGSKHNFWVSLVDPSCWFSSFCVFHQAPALLLLLWFGSFSSAAPAAQGQYKYSCALYTRRVMEHLTLAKCFMFQVWFIGYICIFAFL